MKLAPNREYDFFAAEIKKLNRPFVRWEGLLFRASPLQFAQFVRLLDGMGSYRWGGRWSAAGTFPSVNTSTTETTCLAESSASFTYYNWAPSDVRPKIIVAIQAQFSRIADLTNANALGGKAWLDLRKMLAEDWHKLNAVGYESLTQAFGRAAHDCGAEGLLIPSARVSRGVNLVYFPKSLIKGSKTELLGEDAVKHWIKKK